MKKHIIDELDYILETYGIPSFTSDSEKKYVHEDVKNLFYLIGRLRKGWYDPHMSIYGDEAHDVLAESIEKCNLPNLANDVRNGKYLIP